MWYLSSGGIRGHDKSHQERSWFSWNAFGKFVAHGEMVASKARQGAFGKLFELIIVPHHSSLLVTLLIPLGSHSVKQPLLWSGGSILRMQNKKRV